MKNLIYSILCISIIASPDFSMSQNYWTKLSGPYGGGVTELKKHPGGDLCIIRSEGLYMSSNSGDSWNEIPEGMVNANLSMDISPSGVIYVGKSTGGIWWTANTGQSWSFNPINVAPHSGSWASVVITKINSLGHIFVNSYSSLNGGPTFNQFGNVNAVGVSSDYAFNSSNHVYSASNTGINYSVNSGGSWTNINGNLPANSNATSLFFDDNVLVAGINGSGVYKTSNNGTEWTAINNGITDLSIYRLHKDLEGNYYAGTFNGKVFKSTNGGADWIMIINSGPENRVNAILVDGNSVYLALSSLGIVKSTDNGATWNEKNFNLNLPGINSLAFSDNNEIFAASYSGFIYSPDNGVNWERRNGSLPSPIIYSVLRNDNGNVIAGVYNHGLYRTSDNGMSWQQSNTGIDAGASFRFIKKSPAGYVFAVSNPGFSADTLKMYRSSDNGMSWVKVYQPDFMGLTEFTIDDSGVLYLAGTGMAFQTTIIKSTDNGNTWSATDLTDFFILDNLTSHGSSLYMTFSGNVYTSVDMGLNWNQLSNGGWGTTGLAALEINSMGKIFLAAATGVFVSDDNGNSWTQESSGLPQNISFNNLILDNDEFLYGLTFYDGIFRSTRSTLTSIAGININSPSGFKLEQNYPNPFNPETVISYSLFETGFVTLKVYDILGNEVATLVNQKQNPGTYNYQLSTVNYQLSSGLYFYKLESGNFTETRSMVLIK